MASAFFHPDRRGFLAGCGASALVGLRPVSAQARASLQAKPEAIALRAGTETPVWSLGAPGLRFRRSDVVEFDLSSELPVPVALNWRGLDGVPAVSPLAVRPPLAAGARESATIPLRHAGTLLCDMNLLGGDRASRSRAVVVQEMETVAVDRDEVLLVEEWRVRADGTAVAPGAESRETLKETLVSYTLNGKPSLDISARTNERLRLRFINGSQRSVIALKLEHVEVTVMAIDSQPAEPFAALNGALVLAPGSRVDAFVDVTAPPGTNLHILMHDGRVGRTIGFIIVSRDPPARLAPPPPPSPLPSNGLPAQLDLKGAIRAEFALGAPQGDRFGGWVTPATFAATAPPAFRSRKGRTVVLALTNRSPIANVFHLHGHHFRLLDRLDDGWKPFWLDTLAIEPGQTQRIAFAAEYAGRWLIESVATDWTAPRLVRWYSVE